MENLNYDRIKVAIRYLEEHFREQPSLEEVAEKINLSPFHFQRLFTEWAGVSPKRFLQYLTVNYLKTKLEATTNLLNVTAEAGLSSQSRVHDLFTTLEAVTPQEYKTKGDGIDIHYGFHETPFGRCLIGITTRGVCWLSFLTDPQAEEREYIKLKKHWVRSRIYPDEAETGERIRRIFSKGGNHPFKFNVLVKGTNFQIKVWEALLQIPESYVTTYENLSKMIGHPSAHRAVGSAVGANHVAWLIPCHRVIRKTGLMGEYRWDAIRKKSMIGWEMAKNKSKI